MELKECKEVIKIFNRGSMDTPKNYLNLAENYNLEIIENEQKTSCGIRIINKKTKVAKEFWGFCMCQLFLFNLRCKDVIL